MDWRIAAVAVAACFALPWAAAAQTPSLELDASTLAIVDVQINGRPARLEVDTRLPAVILLNREAAQRLRVRVLPVVRVALDVDDETAVRGRVARPRVVLADGQSIRALTGVFPVPATSASDGRLGPGALPYETLTLRLGADAPNAADIVLPWPEDAHWRSQTTVNGRSLGVSFDIHNQATLFNRDAARVLDRSGDIQASGQPAEREVILGLRTIMQPVTAGFSVAGLALAPAYAMTPSQLVGAVEEDALVVRARAADEEARPGVVLGRAALAHCSSITAHRARREIVLRCANAGAQP